MDPAHLEAWLTTYQAMGYTDLALAATHDVASQHLSPDNNIL